MRHNRGAAFQHLFYIRRCQDTSFRIHPRMLQHYSLFWEPGLAVALAGASTLTGIACLVGIASVVCTRA